MPVLEKSAAGELSDVLTSSIISSLFLKRCDPNQIYKKVTSW
jgi:hypothetical protein